jgi:hypothetical protein
MLRIMTVLQGLSSSHGGDFAHVFQGESPV